MISAGLFDYHGAGEAVELCRGDEIVLVAESDFVAGAPSLNFFYPADLHPDDEPEGECFDGIGANGVEHELMQVAA